MTLQEIISRTEIVECMWQQSCADNTEGPLATGLASYIGNARNVYYLRLYGVKNHAMFIGSFAVSRQRTMTSAC